MMKYTYKQANKLFDSLMGGGAIAFLFLVWVATMPHISKSPSIYIVKYVRNE
jgi:hypothetical protein